MTLLRYSLRGKPQSGEDRIGGGAIGLRIDPFEDAIEAFGSLVDVVPIGDVDNGFEQLFEAFGTAEVFGGRRIIGTAARRARLRPHSRVMTHPTAFPRGCSAATRNPPAAG
jgi:hypothetical protein